MFQGFPPLTSGSLHNVFREMPRRAEFFLEVAYSEFPKYP